MKILFILGLTFFTQALWSAPNSKGSDQDSSKKSTKEVSFDELLVQGKHHFSDEAIVTVEQDQVLDALLEIRKDFKDRIKKSAKRN